MSDEKEMTQTNFVSTFKFPQEGMKAPGGF